MPVKYTFTIWLAMFVSTVAAQQFHKCTIYQYRLNDSSKKKVVCSQLFNSKGRVVDEVVEDYVQYLNVNGAGGTCIGIKEDGHYQYYYNDTALVLSVKSHSDHSRKDRLDTVKTYFYYDDNRRLEKKIMIPHQIIDSPRKFVCDDCEDPNQVILYSSDTTLYFYGRSGNLMREIHNSDGYNTQNNFSYDSINCLITDSFFIKHKFHFVISFAYGAFGYEKRHYFWEGSNPLVTKYSLDEKGRIIEEKSDNEMTKTFYYPDGRISRKLYFGRDYYRQDTDELILTTTHLFVYE